MEILLHVVIIIYNYVYYIHKTYTTCKINPSMMIVIYTMITHRYN